MADQKMMECLGAVCSSLLAKKDLLNELDAVMGDGEHGSNIERTFGKVQEAIPSLETMGNIDVLDKVGSILLAAGGGTATTLMGFAGKKCAGLLRGIEKKDVPAVADVMRKTWVSIQAKSKAEVGDKTLMDAYTPAMEAFEKRASENGTLAECFAAAADAAQQGAKDSEQMIAKRGRGYYVGERGLGTADPGATSVATIFQAIADTLA